MYDPYYNNKNKPSAKISVGEAIGSRSVLSSKRISDVAKIRGEANRLSMQVSSGALTKVQAARALNNYRINLVGNNIVDDSVYEIYLNAIIDSQKGLISSQQSKSLIKEALDEWRVRWGRMSEKDKPSNPAFTNFLMEFMGMNPL